MYVCLDLRQYYPFSKHFNSKCFISPCSLFLLHFFHPAWLYLKPHSLSYFCKHMAFKESKHCQVCVCVMYVSFESLLLLLRWKWKEGTLPFFLFSHYSRYSYVNRDRLSLFSRACEWNFCSCTCGRESERVFHQHFTCSFFVLKWFLCCFIFLQFAACVYIFVERILAKISS